MRINQLLHSQGCNYQIYFGLKAYIYMYEHICSISMWSIVVSLWQSHVASLVIAMENASEPKKRRLSLSLSKHRFAIVSKETLADMTNYKCQKILLKEASGHWRTFESGSMTITKEIQTICVLMMLHDLCQLVSVEFANRCRCHIHVSNFKGIYMHSVQYIIFIALWLPLKYDFNGK